MSKIFKYTTAQGSLFSDPYLGVLSGSPKMVKTTKGTALKLEAGDKIEFSISSVDITNYIALVGGDGQVEVGTNLGWGSFSVTDWIRLNSNVNHNGVTLFRIEALSGTIYLIEADLFNGITEDDFNDLDKRLLDAKQPLKPIRGFNYPKPVDSSHKQGLLAHYNMIPSPGGKLVDISGNGNDVTIKGAQWVKDGIRVSDKAAGVNFPLIELLPSGSTLRLRFMITKVNLSGSYANYNFIAGNSNVYQTNISVNISRALAVESNTNGDYWMPYTVVPIKEFITLEVSADNNVISSYINGVKVTEVTTATTLKLSNLFGDPAVPYMKSACIIEDFQILDYGTTPQQAKDYHNSFQKPLLIEHFDYPVGTEPEGWSYV